VGNALSAAAHPITNSAAARSTVWLALRVAVVFELMIFE